MSPITMRACGVYAFLPLVAIQCFLAGANELVTREPDIADVPNFDEDKPVYKVLRILHELYEQVGSEGRTEATAYADFSCFCRDSTTSIGNLIRECEGEIQVIAATLEEKNQSWADAIVFLQKSKSSLEVVEANLAKEKARLEKAKTKYDLDLAEVVKGLHGIEQAEELLEESLENGHTGTTLDTNFLQLARSTSLKRSLGDASGMLLADAASLMQESVDPKDPSYKFKSRGIVEAMHELNTEIRARRTQLNEDYELLEAASVQRQEAMQVAIDGFKADILTYQANRDKFAGEAAAAKIALSEQESLLDDDQEYLKGVTEKCEARAKDWDQRTQTREDELASLRKVFDVMVGVADKDAANERALIQTKTKDSQEDNSTDDDNATSDSDEQSDDEDADNATDAPGVAPAAPAAAAPEPKPAFVATGSDQGASMESLKSALDGLNNLKFVQQPRFSVASFLQEVRTSSSSVQNAQQHRIRGSIRAHSQQEDKMTATVSQEMLAKQRKWQMDALQIVQEGGRRSKSSELATVAMHLQADPFAKVKNLIVNLIDRLLEEQRAESDKRSFCQSQMGQKEKLAKERKYRWTESLKLANEVKILEARMLTLGSAIEKLGQEIPLVVDLMERTTVQRTAEKAQNTGTIKIAHEGLTGIKECLQIMKDVYGRTGRSAARYEKGEPGYSFVQVKQDQPERVGIYTPAPTGQAEGGYGGNQNQAQGIIVIMQTIQRDFERTITVTEKEEAKAADQYARFMETQTGILANKRKAKEVKESYLTETENEHSTKFEEFEAAVQLVSQLNEVLIELQPMCARTAQNFEERAQARVEDMCVLKRAICALDPNNNEQGCPVTDLECETVTTR